MKLGRGYLFHFFFTKLINDWSAVDPRTLDWPANILDNYPKKGNFWALFDFSLCQYERRGNADSANNSVLGSFLISVLHFSQDFAHLSAALRFLLTLSVALWVSQNTSSMVTNANMGDQGVRRPVNRADLVTSGEEGGQSARILPGSTSK